MTGEQPQNIKSTNDRIGIGIIVTVLVVVILGVFVWQNRDSVEIELGDAQASGETQISEVTAGRWSADSWCLVGPVGYGLK